MKTINKINKTSSNYHTRANGTRLPTRKTSTHIYIYIYMYIHMYKSSQPGARHHLHTTFILLYTGGMKSGEGKKERMQAKVH